MRIQSVALRAASTITIGATALAAALVSAPAQATGSGASAGHHASRDLAAARFAAPHSETGAMTGVVDGAGGRPLTGVCVVATGPGGSATAMTRIDGRYSLGGLRPGGYTLHYSACAAGGGYVDQWSGGASWPGGASIVRIAPGQARALAPVTLRSATSAIHAAIPRSIARLLSGTRPAALSTQRDRVIGATGRGAIAGTVTGGGKALQGICVIAFGGPSFGEVHTSKTGQFRIAKLPPGRYLILFQDQYCSKNSGNWLPQYYKGRNGPVFRRPTRVRVTAGQTTTGIDAALQLGGQISGTVRSRGGKTLSRVCALALGKDGRFEVSGEAASGKNGRYALHSLFPGKYQVAFVPRDCGNKGNYVPQWWRDSATQKRATSIVIKSGSIVRHIDGALGPGAIISGVVRAAGPHGALLKGICVFAEPIGRQGPFPAFAETRTGKNGSYRIVALTTGRYRVTFVRGCGNNGNYLQVHRSVSVVAGHTRSGLDAALPPGAIITGTVTDTHGAPVRGVCVSASGRDFGGSRSNSDGKYSIIALRSGSYTVDFTAGCGNPGSLAPQFYRGQATIGSANPVRATAGRTTPGIDATMQPGGTITGVVTDASGHRLSQICVLLESPSGLQYGFPFLLRQTKHGVFTVRNLVPGVYAVNFSCFLGSNGFASQWFMRRPGQGLADFVSAPAGVVTSGVNAVLRPGGFITGTVTNSAGKPLSSTCVQVTPHGSPVTSQGFLSYGTQAYTNSHGVYRIGPIFGAKYDVQFGCNQARYGSQWYRGTTSRASTTPVPVTDGATVTGVDAVLSAGGSIAGEVMTGAGHPRRNVCVSAQDAADSSSGFAFTNRSGRYKISGLSSDPYQITFFDCGYGRHHVLLGTTTLPDLVKVTAPQAVTGVNEKLVPAGSISGTVLGPPNATPEAGACVVAVPVSPGTSYDYSETGRHGRYQLIGLAPGTYDIYFGDPFCVFAGTSYAPQWFNGQDSQATATGVTVTSGGDTGNVTATLRADGAISGTVTTHPHAAVAGECVTATPVGPTPDPVFDAVMRPVIGITAADGTYTLVGLPPGKYRVKFSVGCGDAGYRTQWWHHSESASGATVIAVSANATVTGIDARLRQH